MATVWLYSKIEVWWKHYVIMIAWKSARMLDATRKLSTGGCASVAMRNGGLITQTKYTTGQLTGGRAAPSLGAARPLRRRGYALNITQGSADMVM